MNDSPNMQKAGQSKQVMIPKLISKGKSIVLKVPKPNAQIMNMCKGNVNNCNKMNDNLKT